MAVSALRPWGPWDVARLCAKLGIAHKDLFCASCDLSAGVVSRLSVAAGGVCKALAQLGKAQMVASFGLPETSGSVPVTRLFFFGLRAVASSCVYSLQISLSLSLDVIVSQAPEDRASGNVKMVGKNTSHL